MSSTRYLGVVIDEQMNWKAHISDLSQKLRAAAATLAKLSCVTDRKTSTIACKAIFEPYLRYGILAYYAAFNNAIRPLGTYQNKVVRLPGGYNNTRTTEDIYKSLEIFSLKRLFLLNLLMECTVRNSEKASELIQGLRPDHRYDIREGVVRPVSTRLVRTDRSYLNRYATSYRENPSAIDAVCAAEKTSQKKRLIREFSGSTKSLLIE